jgi:hypothetical protein
VVSLGPSRLGSDDIATIVGTDSSAFAGADGATVGDFDLAGAFGNSLDATATASTIWSTSCDRLSVFPCAATQFGGLWYRYSFTMTGSPTLTVL